MKPRHVILTLLVAAHAAVLALLVSVAREFGLLYPHWIPAVTVGLIWGQVATAAAWLVFGRSHQGARFLLVALGMPAWVYWSASAMRFPPDVSRSFAELMAYFGITAFALVVARRNSREHFIGNRGWLRAGEPRRRQWQFSLRGLFSVVTITAVVAGMAHWLDHPLRDSLVALVVGFVMSVLALTSLGISAWCTHRNIATRARASLPILSFLGTSRVRATFGLVLLPLLWAMAGSLLSQPAQSNEYRTAIVLMTISQGACIALSMCVARLAERLPRTTTPSALHGSVDAPSFHTTHADATGKVVTETQAISFLTRG